MNESGAGNWNKSPDNAIELKIIALIPAFSLPPLLFRLCPAKYKADTETKQ